MTPLLRKPIPLALLVASIAALVAVWLAGATRQPASGAPPRVPDPKYVTQGSSRSAVRTADVQVSGREIRDSANETCETRTVAQWAEILGTTATPAAVASRFARHNYEISIRDQAYRGCRQTLREQERTVAAR